MKVATIIVRILLGLLFLFASVSYFFNLIPQPPEVPGDLKTFNDGIDAAHYLMPLVKTIELAAGILLITGFFIPLTAVILLPISLNIFGVHAFLAPEGLPIAAFVLLGNLFLLYTYRENYRSLFTIR